MTTTRCARAGLLAAAAGLAGAALSGCGSSSTAASPVSTTTTAAATTTRAASTPVTDTSAPTTAPEAASSATTVATDRAHALAAWKKGAEVSSAELNLYLKQAASDLTAAQAAGADASTYGNAIAQLDELQTIPETDVTVAQKATAQKDIAALDAFFGTPGLYS